MDRNRVTVRYARALLEIATEQKVLDRVYTDMQLLFKAMDEYKGFANYIINPGDLSSVKFRKVTSMFGKDMCDLTIRFLNLVFEKKREEYLKDICRNFLYMAKKAKGILSASLKIAYPVDTEIIQEITSRFEAKTHATIELETSINSELIGGFVFTIDGWQYDASVFSKLQAIKKKLQLK
jgi:F-type H+-transporting ATPase subunit delta